MRTLISSLAVVVAMSAGNSLLADHPEALSLQLKVQAAAVPGLVNADMKGTAAHTQAYLLSYRMYELADDVYDNVKDRKRLDEVHRDLRAIDVMFHQVQDLVRQTAVTPPYAPPAPYPPRGYDYRGRDDRGDYYRDGERSRYDRGRRNADHDDRFSHRNQPRTRQDGPVLLPPQQQQYQSRYRPDYHDRDRFNFGRGHHNDHDHGHDHGRNPHQPVIRTDRVERQLAQLDRTLHELMERFSVQPAEYRGRSGFQSVPDGHYREALRRDSKRIEVHSPLGRFGFSLDID